MERALCWVTIVTICLICPIGGAQGKKATPEERAQAEALYEEGLGLQETDRLDEAAERFQAAIAIDDRHAPSYVGLGHIYLTRGDLKEAEKAFKLALRKQRKYAPAFNGLGLVYSQKKNELRRAIDYFRDANRADKSYSVAQYNLAKTLQKFGHTETLKAYKGVLKIDPKHPDANYQIGLIHEAHQDYQKAEGTYRGQVDANPDHYGARLHLGMVLKVEGQTEEALGVLAKVANTPNDHQRRAVLELGEVYQRRREFDHSQTQFDAYISGLDAKERAPFYDLSLVAGGKELEAFQTAPPEAREATAEAFWARRDPAPVTEANERLLEHYRRVAFAREHFGTYRFPWDARGEAYIRYGNPDHISRSNDIRLERHSRLVDVKDRLVAQAGPAAARLSQDRQNEVLASLSAGTGEEQRRADEQKGRLRQRIAESSFLGWPVYPVDRSWEYWIYADVGKGIEVTFVRKNFPGPYDYADIPLDQGEIARTWRDMHPKIVLDRVVAQEPNAYRPDFATGPLEFYFYSAAFKGEGEKTSLEVYYGIPTRQLTYGTTRAGRQVAYLERGVAVYDSTGRPVGRQSRKMALAAESLVDTSAAAFIPEVDRIDLPPGNYRVAVQVLDRLSGKSEVYNQNRTLPAFGEKELQVSDIELAASIGPTGRRQFLKGDLAVVPMPARAYRAGEPVLIYYEIYNLNRDSFGATKYRVSYEVRSRESGPIGAKLLGGLGNLLGMREEGGVITIEYEQAGTEPEEQAYLELDMSSSEPGEYLLKVLVTDENGEQRVGTTTAFEIR